MNLYRLIRFKFLFRSFIVLLIGILVSCGNDVKELDKEVELAEGLTMNLLGSYNDEPGKIGDIIEFDLLQTFKEKVIVNTFTLPDYRVRVVLNEPEFIGDYMQALLKLGVEDSVLIKVNLANLPEQHLPKGLEEEFGELEFLIKVKNIWNEKTVIEEMVNQLSDNRPETWTTTTRGVRIFWDERGTGEPLEFGDSVRINVKGLFMSGAVFMSSFDKEPISFLVGEGLIVPQAWEDVCSYAKVGDKLTIISPYDMAFGSVDRKPILKYSTLVFEIDILNVIKPY